jgi:O-6-methylguanine DNA methyltransferase
VRTATRTRVAWDLPVRLVSNDGSSQAERRVGPLRLGSDFIGDAAIPGLAALRVMVGRHDGRDHLLAIDPNDDRSGDAAPDRSAGELSAALDELRDPEDGALPVLVDGSPFALDVLTALCRIPLGERRSYAELAAAAGRPHAVRAVASVMARNRTPLVLPCHRIVPSSGGTGRYAWGESAKAALLAAEAKHLADTP